MSKYLEFKNQIAFHPGYYIEEYINEMGLTQKDFARRLGTTPKNLSVLLQGEQKLSADLANKLANMLDTSVAFWLNLQAKYDEIEAKIHEYQDLASEKEVLKTFGYAYLRDHFGAPNLPRQTDQQICVARKILQIGSLNNLRQKDFVTCFRSYFTDPKDNNTICSNVMLQLAVNQAWPVEAPPYDEDKFRRAIDFALTQTTSHETFFEAIQEAFLAAGVILVGLPHLAGSGVNGATKPIGDNILLMVSDRRRYVDTLWFSLFHEIAHILKGHYKRKDRDDELKKKIEQEADDFARQALIPEDAYQAFVARTAPHFSVAKIREFADRIDRDPGIVLGRLQMDHHVTYKENKYTRALRTPYNFAPIKRKAC